MADARTGPGAPPLRLLGLLRQLLFVILKFFLLELPVVLLNNRVVVTGLQQLALGQAKFCSLGLVLVFETVDRDAFSELGLGVEDLLEISLDEVGFGVGRLSPAVQAFSKGLPCGLLLGLLLLVLHNLAFVEESGDLLGLLSVLGYFFFPSHLHEFH